MIYLSALENKALLSLSSNSATFFSSLAEGLGMNNGTDFSKNQTNKTIVNGIIKRLQKKLRALKLTISRIFKYFIISILSLFGGLSSGR